MLRFEKILSALLVMTPLLSCTSQEKPMNFVVFLIDDMGWTDLGCYGSDLYETPNIDRLIEFYEDGRLELYDLNADIGEQNNLVDTLPRVAQSMHGELVQWRRTVEAQLPIDNPDHIPKN